LEEDGGGLKGRKKKMVFYLHFLLIRKD